MSDVSQVYTKKGTMNFKDAQARKDIEKFKNNPNFEGSISLDRVNGSSIGELSVATGYSVVAGGRASHAEGGETSANGHYSHAEGYQTSADGDYSHAEGQNSITRGRASHAEGHGTIASGADTHVFGRYNLDRNNNTPSDYSGTMVEIVGNGADHYSRSNARTLDWNGNETLSGSLTCSNSITIGSTTITEAQLQALLNLITTQEGA